MTDERICDTCVHYVSWCICKRPTDGHEILVFPFQGCDNWEGPRKVKGITWEPKANRGKGG